MAPSTEKFRELLTRANAGDGEAYREFLIALTPFLREIVRRGLVSAGRTIDDSEDIVQEVLLAVHLKRQSWDDTQPVTPWVRAIANHKLIDFLRRRGNRGHLNIDDLAEGLPTAGGDDVAHVIDRDRLLSCLPLQSKRIVEALAIEGHSTRDVARAFGMTEGAVRVALHRALKKMAGRAGESEG